jgi:hypothetical protein
VSEPHDEPQEVFAPARLWVLAWTVFLSAIFGFGWYKSWENRQYELASARWSDELKEFLLHSNVESNRILEHLHRLHGKPDSQIQLERQINRGEPFDLREIGGRETVDWNDPAYHDLRARLEFENGVLKGFRLTRTNDFRTFARHHPPPSRTHFTGTAEQWRRWIARLGSGIWLIALAVWFALARRRLFVSQILLAAALASGMAWLVNPGYSISRRGVFSNESLFWALVMLTLGIYLLAMTMALYSPRMGLKLPSFRFRLRQLLLAVTVAAALLAAGPFGWVAFAIGIAGTLLFATVYHYHRSRLESPL